MLFYDPADVSNLISGSSAFSESSLNIWKFLVHVLLKPSLEILSITLLACKMGAIMQCFEYSLALPFFGIGMKTDIPANTLLFFLHSMYIVHAGKVSCV